MNKKLFSVVVPMYNAERFLGECLDSLINQSLHNFVVILVDDGSSDKTKEIASSYVSKHPEIFTYVYQTNKGLGGARNTGINLLKTEYALFLDSDDFIASKTIENLTNYLKNLEYKPDIIITEPLVYNQIDGTYSEFKDNVDVEEVFKDTSSSNVKKDPRLLSLEVSFWRCIWRVEFLVNSGVRFKEHIAWEDVHPHFSLFYKANIISKYSDSPTFFYRVNSGGQITSGTGKTRLDIAKVFNDVVDQMKEENWSYPERGQVIKVMQDFVIWSLNVVSDEYRSLYLDSVNALYRRIDGKEYKGYKKYAITSLKNRIIFKIIRSKSLVKIFKNRAITTLFFSYYKMIKSKIGKLLGRGENV